MIGFFFAICFCRDLLSSWVADNHANYYLIIYYVFEGIFDDDLNHTMSILQCVLINLEEESDP